MLSFGLSLLGIGKNILSWLSAGVKWIFADMHRIAIAVLLGVCVWLYMGKMQESRRADKMTTVAAKWESAYVLLVDAQRLATIAAEKNKARVEARYQEINDEAEQDYERRLSDSRAALQRWMQNRGSSASKGDSTGGTEMPAEPMPGTTEALIPVRIEDLEIAADNYAQLTALIAWAEKIGDVNTGEELMPK